MILHATNRDWSGTERWPPPPPTMTATGTPSSSGALRLYSGVTPSLQAHFRSPPETGRRPTERRTIPDATSAGPTARQASPRSDAASSSVRPPLVVGGCVQAIIAASGSTVRRSGSFSGAGELEANGVSFWRVVAKAATPLSVGQLPYPGRRATMSSSHH